MPLARAAGLSGGLDELAHELFGVGKDSQGQALLKMISKPVKDGTFAPITPEQLKVLVRYNIQDVLLLAKVYEVVKEFGEPDVLAADLAINQRGIVFDCELAKQLITLEQVSLASLCSHMETETKGAVKRKDLGRTKFLREWFKSNGLTLDNLQYETIKDILARDSNIASDVRAVLEARLANNRHMGAKLHKAIGACGEDGRMRDQFVYHGAHTGRWSSRGVQLHNLPRPHRLLGDAERLLQRVTDYSDFVAALPQGVSVSEGVASMIRPCFRSARRKPWSSQTSQVLKLAASLGVQTRPAFWTCFVMERTYIAI